MNEDVCERSGAGRIPRIGRFDRLEDLLLKVERVEAPAREDEVRLAAARLDDDETGP